LHSLNFKPISIQLDELEPLFEPEQVSFTFNTPAWYALGVFLALILIYVIFVQFKKYQKNQYRREALRLVSSWKDVNAIKDAPVLIDNIRILLKQLAMARYGRLQVASLYGNDWLQFLESKGINTPFTNYNILINSDLELDLEKEKQQIMDLVEVSKKWIKTHA